MTRSTHPERFSCDVCGGCHATHEPHEPVPCGRIASATHCCDRMGAALFEELSDEGDVCRAELALRRLKP